MEGKKEKEVVDGYRRVKQLWPRMLEGEGEPRQQWMLEAEKLIEAFRETRCLFSTTGVRFFLPSRYPSLSQYVDFHRHVPHSKTHSRGGRRGQDAMPSSVRPRWVWVCLIKLPIH